MNKIAEYRKRKKLTQDDLAKALGVTRQAIQNWEKEKREPKEADWSRIASILNVDVARLKNKHLVTLSYDEYLAFQLTEAQKEAHERLIATYKKATSKDTIGFGASTAQAGAWFDAVRGWLDDETTLKDAVIAAGLDPETHPDELKSWLVKYIVSPHYSAESRDKGYFGADIYLANELGVLDDSDCNTIKDITNKTTNERA